MLCSPQHEAFLPTLSHGHANYKLNSVSRHAHMLIQGAHKGLLVETGPNCRHFRMQKTFGETDSPIHTPFWEKYCGIPLLCWRWITWRPPRNLLQLGTPAGGCHPIFSLGIYHKQHLSFIYSETIVLSFLKVEVYLEWSETCKLWCFHSSPQMKGVNLQKMCSFSTSLPWNLKTSGISPLALILKWEFCFRFQ